MLPDGNAKKIIDDFTVGDGEEERGIFKNPLFLSIDRSIDGEKLILTLF